MLHRRPAWAQLLKTGIDLGPELFLVARRPLSWRLTVYPPNAVLPTDMPLHRLRQLYEMRRLDAVPELLDMTRGPIRQAAKAAIPPELKPAAPVAEVTPVKAGDSHTRLPIETATIPVAEEPMTYRPSRKKG